jgi:hypothetical protein
VDLFFETQNLSSAVVRVLVQGRGGAAKKTNVTIDSVFLGSEYNNAQLVSVFVFN